MRGEKLILFAIFLVLVLFVSACSKGTITAGTTLVTSEPAEEAVEETAEEEPEEEEVEEEEEDAAPQKVEEGIPGTCVTREHSIAVYDEDNSKRVYRNFCLDKKILVKYICKDGADFAESVTECTTTCQAIGDYYGQCK